MCRVQRQSSSQWGKNGNFLLVLTGKKRKTSHRWYGFTMLPCLAVSAPSQYSGAIPRYLHSLHCTAMPSADVLGEDASGPPVRDSAVFRQGPGALPVSRRVLQIPLHGHGRQWLPYGDRGQHLILARKTETIVTFLACCILEEKPVILVEKVLSKFTLSLSGEKCGTPGVELLLGMYMHRRHPEGTVETKRSIILSVGFFLPFLAARRGALQEACAFGVCVRVCTVGVGCTMRITGYFLDVACSASAVAAPTHLQYTCLLRAQNVTERPTSQDSFFCLPLLSSYLLGLWSNDRPGRPTCISYDT